MERIAPILPSATVGLAMDFYHRLGFAVRANHGGEYAFASWHGIGIHLGVLPGEDHQTGAAYLFVDDADVVAADWRLGQR